MPCFLEVKYFWKVLLPADCITIQLSDLLIVAQVLNWVTEESKGCAVVVLFQEKLMNFVHVSVHLFYDGSKSGCDPSNANSIFQPCLKQSGFLDLSAPYIAYLVMLSWFPRILKICQKNPRVEGRTLGMRTMWISSRSLFIHVVLPVALQCRTVHRRQCSLFFSSLIKSGAFQLRRRQQSVASGTAR